MTNQGEGQRGESEDGGKEKCLLVIEAQMHRLQSTSIFQDLKHHYCTWWILFHQKNKCIYFKFLSTTKVLTTEVLLISSPQMEIFRVLVCKTMPCSVFFSWWPKDFYWKSKDQRAIHVFPCLTVPAKPYALCGLHSQVPWTACFLNHFRLGLCSRHLSCLHHSLSTRLRFRSPMNQVGSLLQA